MFFAFGDQACEAARQGVWSGEKTRIELQKYLDRVATAVYFAACPTVFRAASSVGDRRSIDGLIGVVCSCDEWLELQKKLQKVAEEKISQSTPTSPVLPQRRGYRQEVRAWMMRKEFTSVKIAAKSLGVSESTLKSIMSDRGYQRYGRDRLDAVLKKIGISELTGE